MENESIKITRKEKWYSTYRFPLIPVYTYRKGDKYNTKSLSFRWLFFTFWTLDSFQFELSFVIDTHWGIGITGILPYFRWTLCIPCPEKLGIKITNLLDRKTSFVKNGCRE